MGEEGGQRALAGQYARLAPAIYRRARALLQSEPDARDVVHDVFERILEDPAAFRGASTAWTYCYRVTTNVCLNLLRARKVRSEPHEPDADEAYQPARVEARELLLKLVERLDPDDAQVAVLHFFDQLTQEEIAQVVGHTRKTVGLALQRVRRLANELADRDSSHG